MIREILVTRPKQRNTSIENACNVLLRALHRRSLVFLISDFYADALEKPIGKLARKHETVAIRIKDRLESKLINGGKVVMMDPETGFETEINTNNSNLRMGYAKLMQRQHEGVEAICKKHGIDLADLRTDGNTLAALHKLLKSRSRKRAR